MTAVPVSPTVDQESPTPMLAALRERLQKLADLRRQHTETKASLAALRETFEADHQASITLEERLRDQVAAEDAAVREIAASHYRATKEKQPVPGVAIQIKTTLNYDDVKALDWARENGAALLLDRKGFEAIAKAMPLPFVTKAETPAVSIARDLDAVLGGAE